jgi:hypothetical protein
MRDITLKFDVKYRPFPYFKKKVKQVNLDLKVPAIWNELTREQLIEIIRIQLSYKAGHLQNLMLLKTLLNIKWGIVHNFSMVQRLQLYPVLQFLNRIGLTRQLIPTLRIKKQTLYAPLERFRNLTFAEFIYCDTLFSFYVKHNKGQYLDKLIACLYRRQRKDYHPTSAGFKGDIREEFNEHLIEHRAKLVEQLPYFEKYAILTWYRGCRQELEKVYDKVFTQENQQKASDGDWGDVLLSLSGEKFGPLEQTAGQRVHTVFKEMQRKAKDHEAIERRNKNNPS